MVLETYLEHLEPPDRLASGAVDELDLLKMLEAARWAPSADNQQAWRFIVVESRHIESVLLEAIEAQDPRLRGRPGAGLVPLTVRELDRVGVDFTPGSYDPRSDPFREDLARAAPADRACAETASAFIVCTSQSHLLGKAFGELEMGAAVLNLYLMAHKLGYAARIVRNFDRGLVRRACAVPEGFQITALVGIGRPADGALPGGTWSQEEARAALGVSLEDLILDRRSVRKYRKEEIPASLLGAVRRLLGVLPTFSREAFFDLRLIDDADLLRSVARHARLAFVKQRQVGIAPAAAAITYRPSGVAGFYGRMDVGMVFQAVLMEAYANGVGTCWTGAFQRSRVRRLLKVPEGWRIEGLITMGYPGEYPQPPPRLPVAGLAYRDLWGAPMVADRPAGFAEAGVTSLVRRSLLSTDARTILRDRDAGRPLVRGFKEAFDLRVARGRMV